MSIEKKFLFTFISVITTFIIGGIVLWSILSKNHSSFYITHKAITQSKSLQSVLSIARDYKAATLAMTITRRRQQEVEAQRLLAELLQALDANEATTPELVRTVKPMVKEYAELMATVSEELASQNRNRGISLYANEASKREKDIYEFIEKIVDEASQTAEKEIRDLETNQRLMQLAVVTVGGVISTLILIILIAAHKALRDFGNIVDVMDRVAAGAAHTDLPFLKRNDEIGTMSRALDAFRQATERQRKLEIESAHKEETKQNRIAQPYIYKIRKKH